MELSTIARCFAMTLSFFIITMHFFFSFNLMREFWSEISNAKDRRFLVYFIIKTVIAVSLVAIALKFLE